MIVAGAMIEVPVESTKSATPFERGRAAGRGLAETANPFTAKTIEHHNFEIGRLSGAALSGPVVMPDPSDAFFHRLD